MALAIFKPRVPSSNPGRSIIQKCFCEGGGCVCVCVKQMLTLQFVGYQPSVIRHSTETTEPLRCSRHQKEKEENSPQIKKTFLINFSHFAPWLESIHDMKYNLRIFTTFKAKTITTWILKSRRIVQSYAYCCIYIGCKSFGIGEGKTKSKWISKCRNER